MNKVKVSIGDGVYLCAVEDTDPRTKGVFVRLEDQDGKELHPLALVKRNEKAGKKTTDALIDAHLKRAKAIAFDGCHKVYILLDEATVEEFVGLGYGYKEDDSRLYHIGENLTREDAKEFLRIWFDSACPLRFIDAVDESEHHTVIDQCEDWVHAPSDLLVSVNENEQKGFTKEINIDIGHVFEKMTRE